MGEEQLLLAMNECQRFGVSSQLSHRIQALSWLVSMPLAAFA